MAALCNYYNRRGWTASDDAGILAPRIRRIRGEASLPRASTSRQSTQSFWFSVALRCCMSTSGKWLLLLGLALLGWGPGVQAQKSTVCTITVNSADEKETLRRSLPADQYDFVELVEHGRPDWLASACRQGVRCDVLVISGHFDAGTEFYTDRVDRREFLPVSEMERVSCSESCPGLFSQLKEVYLFGCNTLNPQTAESTAAEITRSLVRAGQSPADAERIAQSLSQRHAESNRDAMRRIFPNVPAIYGFSSLAPLGPTAAMLLNRYFDSTPELEIGTGRPSWRLLSQFAANSMTVTSGVGYSDNGVDYRQEVCKFFDERLSPAQKLAFIHDILRRDMAEVRMFFDRIEAFFASLSEEDRRSATFQQALETLARDQAARDRYLAFARDVDQLSTRSRMIQIASTVGWLSPDEQRVELVRMINEQLADSRTGSAEVNLICALNKERNLELEAGRVKLSAQQAKSVTASAALACLGNSDAHARILRALSSPNMDDISLAQVYLHHYPLTDVRDLRSVANAIAKMPVPDAQARALDTLSRQYLSDRESLDELTRLFRTSKSVTVQRAVAGVLLRSDHSVFAKPELVRVLREYRRKSPDGEDVIDVLIRRLQAA
jgi:hypothetical protein